MKRRSKDNEYTNEIVCPFCGYEFCDSWEYGSDSNEDLGLIECPECEKEFYAIRHISISYSTEKAKYGTCKKCNAENVVLTDYHSSIGAYEGLCTKCGDEEKQKIYKKLIE